MSKSIAGCPGIIYILFLLPCALLAQPDRITAPIDSVRTVVLKGNVHPDAQPQSHLGPVEPSFRLSYITLTLKKTAAQQAALEQLLEDQQNPASPNYHDWLTPEQYADRFGLSQHDMDSISAWLQSEGFTVEYTARGRNWLAFSGTAGQVRATFRTEVHRYRVDGELHFAAAADPSVPAVLEPVVAGFLGLDDFYPKAPKHPRPAYTDGGGLHSLTPDDIATIYDINKLYQANMNGAGQSIVVVGQSAIDSSDITGFRNRYNLPPLSLQIKVYPTDAGNTDDTVEGDLDLEWVGAIARNANLIYVYGRSALDAALYAIDNNLAPVISQSFGICEPLANRSLSSYYRTEAQKASLEGITWLAASGDNGAADCGYEGYITYYLHLAVDFPASIPEVTAVGGTEFTDQSGAAWNTTNGPNGGSAVSYIPEIAWNDTSAQWGLAATGGGASSLYPKPSWQTGAGVPNDRARDLPDLSLTAGLNNPYNVLSQGSWLQAGGTSASTPVFAGIVTLLNHYLVANRVQSKPGVGNINPTLYRLSQSSAFHDVSVGSNIVSCATRGRDCGSEPIGYNAGPGYDLATGLGSVDAYNLVTQWNGSSSGTTATTTSVTANPSSITVSGSTTLTSTVKASSGSTLPTGSVSFMLGSTLLGAANLFVSSGVATTTLNVSGSSLIAGANTVTASYGGSTGFGASSGSVTVTVTVPVVATTTNVTANPTSTTASGGTTLTATVQAGSGSTTPAGSVSFMLGSTLLGAANLSGSSGMATASLYVAGSLLTAGNNTITASYGGSTGFSASSGSVMVTLPLPMPLPTLGSVTNAASYATGAVFPGEMVTIFGTAIGPATPAYATTDPATGKLATTIGGVEVLFNGVPAPMIYANSTQVSAVVPYEMASVATPSVWIKYTNQTSNVFQLTSATTAPALFTQNASGSGAGAILNQDNSVNGPNNPAATGSIVQVYLTGEGQTSPQGVTGAVTTATLPPPQVTPAPLLATGVTINGQPALCVYAGEAPGLVAGMMQLNVQIPSSTPSGNLPIAVSIGGNVSQSRVTVSVK